MLCLGAVADQQGNRGVSSPPTGRQAMEPPHPTPPFSFAAIEAREIGDIWGSWRLKMSRSQNKKDPVPKFEPQLSCLFIESSGSLASSRHWCIASNRRTCRPRKKMVEQRWMGYGGLWLGAIGLDRWVVKISHRTCPCIIFLYVFFSFSPFSCSYTSSFHKVSCCILKLWVVQ